jgi:hypothetical protein
MVNESTATLAKPAIDKKALDRSKISRWLVHKAVLNQLNAVYAVSKRRFRSNLGRFGQSNADANDQALIRLADRHVQSRGLMSHANSTWIGGARRPRRPSTRSAADATQTDQSGMLSCFLS